MMGAASSSFQLVCVLGAPRSGTTFLQNLIATHPRVTTCPETNFFIQISKCGLYHRNLPPWFLKPPVEMLAPDGAERLRKKIMTHTAWIKNGPFCEELKKPISLRNFADLFFQSAMREPAREIYLEKTPSHIHFLPTIQTLYPLAKIIHIVRDPRDTIASYQGMLHKQGKPSRFAFECSRIWMSAVASASSRNIMTVRYEDLVQNTISEMEKIGAFIGVSYTSDLLEMQNQVSRKSVLEKETWKANNLVSGSPSKKSAVLTENEKKIISFCCRKGMKQYGYVPESSGERVAWFFLLCKQMTAYIWMRGSTWLGRRER